MRHSIAGERAIKEQNELYLPRPSGMARNPQGNDAYLAYKKRGRFPDIVGPSVQALVGRLLRKPAVIELPARLEYLRERATPDGLSLQSLIRRIAVEQVSTGRVGLLADAPEAGGDPYLSVQDAEVVINWREAVVDGERKLILAVLETESVEPAPDDEFDLLPVKEWRVLRFAEGVYSVDLWRQSSADKQPMLMEADIIPNRRGDPMDTIPLVLIGSCDLTPDLDEIPLLPVARDALSAYLTDTDHRQGLFMSSQPTPVVTGMSANEEDRPTSIGSSTVWFLPDPQSDAKFLEVSGHGYQWQRRQIDADMERAAQHGAALLQTTTRGVEAAETARLRESGRTATLETLAATLGAGLTQALRWCAEWVGADPAQVQVIPNTDFLDQRIGAQELTALIGAWTSGAMPQRDLWAQLRQGEIVAADRTDEDLEADLAAETASLPALTSPGDA